MPRPEVFLSHANADKEAVKAIALQLKQHTISTWLDEWNLVPGQPWVDAIGQALRECSGCIVFLGPGGAGPWHHEEVRSALDLAARDGAYRLVPVLLPGARRERLSQLPGFLTNRTWVDFSNGLDDPDAIHRLVCGIQGTEPGPPFGASHAPGRTPYRGLRVFDVNDAPLFFGREVLTQELLAKLAISEPGGPRFISIVGPSGSGKSSLARAGLLASLRAGGLQESACWPQIIIRPGQNPLDSLAIGVVSKLAPCLDPSELIRRFLAEEQGLHRQVKVALQHRTDLRAVLLVDQAEEAFTLGSRDDERAAFFANLVYAATIHSGQVLLVLAFRSDFYSRFAEYQQLASLVSENQLLVPPMSEIELRRAIALPAERTGRSFRPALVDEMLSDAKGRPGCLPLLEHALAQLWERSERVLGIEEYSSIGKLAGALNSRAEALFASLTASQQEACRRLFLRLVQPAEVVLDTRRRVASTELPVDQHEVSQAFAAEGVHLLIWFQQGDHQFLEVAHEELIRRWERLQQWVRADRHGQRTHRRLTAAVAEWKTQTSGGQDDDSFLYRGAALAEVEEWLDRLPDNERSNVLNPDETAFLKHSRSARDRARLDQERRLSEVQELATKTEALRAAELQRRRDAEAFARRLRYGLGAAVAMALLAAGAGAIAIAKGNAVQKAKEAALLRQLTAVANSLNSVAGMYAQQGQNDRAESLYKQVLAMREAALGKNDRDVAQSLNNLANLYSQQGLYSQAEPLYERALAIREATLGTSHPDVAQSLNDLARLRSARGQYLQAEPLYERAFAIRETALGKTHPDVAQSLNSLATLYTQLGRYDQAEPLYRRALAIREAALGKEHPDVAQFLDLADLLRQQQRLDEAEALYARALAIQEAALGKAHPDVAASLNNLATLYSQQGLYSKAEPLYERALNIQEAALGKQHPDVAASLDNLADLYFQEGLYSRAEPLYLRALAIHEAALGKEHPEVARSLNGLGNLYSQQGIFSRAEPLYLRALAIREAALGKGHPEVARSLNNLANLYSRQGLYSRAEPLYLRALAIREAALGRAHPEVAGSLNNLADLFLQQGLYGRAEPLYERALAIREMALGKSHPDVAQSLDSLAILYLQQGLYSKAEPLCLRALAIQEAALAKAHPDVARSLSILAALDSRLGRYDQARLSYARTIAIQEAALGKDHPDVAQSLNNQADLYSEQGLYDRAESLYLRALRIRGASLGELHPDVANTLNGLGMLRVRQQRLAEALPLFSRALAISEGRIRHEALGLSEFRLASLLWLLGKNEEPLYSLLRAHPDNSDVRRLALTAVLLFKGRAVEEAANISRTNILQSMGPEDRETFDRLRRLRTQMASLSLDGPGKLAPAEYQRRLKQLSGDGDALEADLAARSAPLRALTKMPSAANIVEHVAAAIPRDGVLVEFVAYGDVPLGPRPGTPDPEVAAQARYLALVLFPDGHTAAVDLGPADAINKAALHLRDALATREAAFQASAQRLHQLAFRPLLRVFGNTRRVFLAPDSQLSLTPFAALHDGRLHLADSYDFTYLTSGRDLLPRPEGIPASTSTVVFADPYAGDSMRWPSLPGARREAEVIRHLLPQTQIFLGAEASKERLLRLAGPGILHIATHGFFLSDTTAPTAGSRSLGPPILNNALRVPPDPLLRSGLVLAEGSASVSPDGGSPSSRGNVSLVTSLELAGLNLWGTQLVVLSSCDTGLGDVQRGQGVYGLRQAFIVAGAETVVSSLWKVDDEAGSTLMENYYRNLLAGQGRASALRRAMLSLRSQRPHPYYWAPFIALGRDTPLRGFDLPRPGPTPP